MKIDFKKRMVWMTSVALAAVVMISSCNNDDGLDNRRRQQPVQPDDQEQTVKTAADVLGLIDRVTIIKDTIDKDNSSVVYFYFNQPIDHKNPDAGTFQQYCVLHYEHPDSVTVLHTQGYSITERQYFRQIDLSKNFGGNYLEVEHRYYKRSEIGDSRREARTASYWEYNTAAQSTADLHEIVTAFKATNAFNGKWISSGVSKNGMLTSLYAYYYPNEVDVYVPFCAPFCVGQETPGIGQYTTQQCGKGIEAIEKCWTALRTYLLNPELQAEVEELYKSDYPDNEKVQEYTLQEVKRIIVYRYMRFMFQKFAYHQISEWEDVIPGPFASALKYYLFASLGKDNFKKKLIALRKVYEKEGHDDDIDDFDYEEDTYDDYEDYDEEDEKYWNEDTPEESNDSKTVPKKILQDIYHIHAAKELGYFLFDWQWLLNEGLIDATDLNVFYKWQTSKRYNGYYSVTYDEGKLMKDFLQFVQNNRNDKKCRMLFIYGANDPWTGAAIPDPAADDPYVKKYIVPSGLHSGHLNNTSHYSESDKNYIINTIRQFLTPNS